MRAGWSSLPYWRCKAYNKSNSHDIKKASKSYYCVNLSPDERCRFHKHRGLWQIHGYLMLSGSRWSLRLSRRSAYRAVFKCHRIASSEERRILTHWPIASDFPIREILAWKSWVVSVTLARDILYCDISCPGPSPETLLIAEFSTCR